MQVKRITYEQVRDAQIRTKLALSQGSFVVNDNCACPLTILYLDSTNLAPTGNGSEVVNWAYATFGEAYTTGFWQGFDDWTHYFPESKDPSLVELGYNDGKQVLQEAKDKQLFGSDI